MNKKKEEKQRLQTKQNMQVAGLYLDIQINNTPIRYY
jgi:hypothetical protein